MAKLPEEQRLAVALVLVEGMSYKEAAEVLEIPIGTLTSRLARGRTALAAALGGRAVNYDDETLMAYADGELDAAQRAEIAAAIERDPALARRVEQHRALRAEVAGAFATVLEQPVPERLRAAAARRRRRAAARQRGAVSGARRARPARAAGARASGSRWRQASCSGVFVVLALLRAGGDAGLIEPRATARWWRAVRWRKALDQQLASEQDRERGRC